MQLDMGSIKYTTVQGPEGLRIFLDDLLEQSKSSVGETLTEHYILYQLGNQKSLIKVDTARTPFYFWYYDLLGRPSTRIVKDTIAEFLWDKCGEKERYLQELASREV